MMRRNDDKLLSSVLVLAALSVAAGLVGSPSPAAAAARQMLFEDQQGALFRRADREEELLRPNMKLMTAPTDKEKRQRSKKRQRGRGGGGGGMGFGGGGGGKAGAGGTKSPAKKLGPSGKEAARLNDIVTEDGVVLIPDVLDRDAAAQLRECVLDEIEVSREAVRVDPSASVRHFNAPVETHDPLRGYYLLPFVDSASVAAKDSGGGPMVSAMRGLLREGTVLGDLFESACGGDAEKAVFYDWTVLRTEAGARRQPVHYDTGHQEIPGLFCAFVALQDVTEEMGGTMFLPRTQTPTEERLKYDMSDKDEQMRDEFLTEARPQYALLKAGDAAFFDMRVLHAGLPNMKAEDGGGKRIILAVTFCNPEAREELGHKSNMRQGYVGKYTLSDLRRELASSAPFALAGDGL